jgi:ABC-type phosphate/phosphonate transport system substrate-binding protein
VSQVSYASLAMYPFEPLHRAWERVWSAIHDQAPWTPESLRWDGDAPDHWTDPDCLVAQACGWPVVTSLRGHVEVVGAFTLALNDGDGHRYRSVVMANRRAALADLVAERAIAAVNAPDSLSGWVSLLAAAVGPGGAWPGPVRWTGGHVESLRALRDGRADVASIDALSLSFVRRYHPDLVVGLHEIDRGPWVPSLPVVVRAGTPAPRVDVLRRAIVGAFDGRALAGARDELLLDGFAPLGDRDYEPLLDLAPAVGAVDSTR